jgi:hypothetical protein
MECELWPPLYALIMKVGKRSRRGGVRYSDAVIVLVFCWACLHDRPQGWACEPRNWKSTHLRPVQLPSDSTLSRRLESPSVKALRRALEQEVRSIGIPGLLRVIDGKPLPVGTYSKDPDAKWGHVSKRKMLRGYRLHAIWSDRPLPEVWTVRPMNENESPVAESLIPQLTGTGYLLADAQYDVNKLHDLAMTYLHKLVACPRNRRAKGIGHMRQSPHRLHALLMLKRPFGQALIQQRGNIERSFGNATSFAGGLGPLPSWVRRLHRVHRWVQAKLLINALRITVHKRVAA